MSKYLLRTNLQLFAGEGESGVEAAPAAEGQTETPQVESSESGAETQVAAEPEKSNNFEKAFAKRLAAEREKWQAESQEKYKGHDDYKLVADYLQEANGLDLMTLKERIEMERLQTRAEQQGISPEMQKRLEALEEKAAKGDALEQKFQEEQRVSSYWSGLNEFAKGKEGIDAQTLNQFMIENGLMYDPSNMEKSFNVAYKAMMHDQLQSKLESAEKEGVKKFLQAKGAIPTVPGSTSQGHVSAPSPKTFAEARQRAMQRLSGE